MNKVESFVFFRDWDLSKREEALKELVEHGIKYIIISGGVSLPDVYESKEKVEEARDFLSLAYEKYGIKSVFHGWKGRKGRLFIDSEVAKEHAHVIAKALEKLRDVEGVYAVYLDDEPYYTWDFSIERVRDEYNDLFEKETGYRLPESGRVKGRWSYETAVAFCKWVGRKYVEYLKTIITEYKKVCPRVKSAVNFHLPAIFPAAENPVDVYGIIETVDIVMHDIYPGWHQYPRALDHIVAFETKFLRDLTDKEFWTILQGHKIMLGYAPSLERIEKWAIDAVNAGSDFVGWYAHEHNYMIGIQVPLKTMYTKYSCPERWRKMLEVSKKITKLEKRGSKANVAILASYESILAYGWRPLMYTYITINRDAGIEVDFITEKQIKENPGKLEKYNYMILGHTPIIDETILPILEKHVENGATLIACCNDIQYNEKLKPLEEWRKRLFGIIKEKTFWRNLTITVTIPGLEDVKLKGFWERRAITETIEVKVLATWENGKPVITAKKIGKGQTIYIATQPYLANCIDNQRGWIQVFKKIIVHQ